MRLSPGTHTRTFPYLIVKRHATSWLRLHPLVAYSSCATVIWVVQLPDTGTGQLCDIEQYARAFLGEPGSKPKGCPYGDGI